MFSLSISEFISSTEEMVFFKVKLLQTCLNLAQSLLGDFFIKEMGFLESISRITGKCEEKKSLTALQVVLNAMLVR